MMSPRRRRPPFTRRFFRHPRELAGWILNRPSRRRVKVATSLRFLHEVLGLDHLHYGIWADEPLSLEGLKAAQARYSELLLSWIPDGVTRILDVGPGVGTDALTLRERGYEIEGLSPDPYQGERFRDRTGLPFHLSRFQTFEAERDFDLLLMSESAQYIWLEALFEKARRLAPGGYLLIADYFQDGGPIDRAPGSGHPLETFLREAETQRLRLLRREDVTERVLSTLELATSWVEKYVDTTLAIAGDSMSSRWPLLQRPVRRWLEAKIGTDSSLRRRLDAESFARDKKYLLLLFRIER